MTDATLTLRLSNDAEHTVGGLVDALHRECERHTEGIGDLFPVAGRSASITLTGDVDEATVTASAGDDETMPWTDLLTQLHDSATSAAMTLREGGFRVHAEAARITLEVHPDE